MTTFLRRHRAWIIGLALLAPCLWFVSAHGVHAQVTANELLPTEVGTAIGTGTGDIRITIANVIRIALGFLGTIALLIILYAGFLWLTAGGDEEKVTRAKKTLTSAVIGLIIILSAFAITQFLLTSLINATTRGTTQNGGGGGGGGGLGGGGDAFHPTGIRPVGSLDKYDVVASVTFNSAPTSDVNNIKSNIKLEKVTPTGRTSVPYDPIVENDIIRLQPTQTCPAPNAAKHCLEIGQNYEINVISGLKAADGSTTVSCGIASACKQAFKTGSTVAIGVPTVSISSPTDGKSVKADDLVAVQSISTDPNGLASVEYSADGAFFKADGAPQSVAASTYASQTVWETTGITPVKTVALTARATNIDGEQGSSAPVRVTVRPGYCFNGVKDGDEAAVDCGGSCGSCTGGSCTSNTDCTSGQCLGGLCVENPQITDVALDDGKPGNLVTVSGEHFGSSAGTVTFLGASATGDEKAAPLASCSGAWSDTRIVIAVPAGAVTGPIQVSVAGGAKKDATNDTYGKVINNFQVNDTARPGVCSVSPASLKIGQVMTVTGLAFGAAKGGSRVQLARATSDCLQAQDWPSAAEASQVSPWTDTSFQPTLPNVDTGTDGANYLLRAVVGGQPSNTGCLRAEPPSAGTEPRIDLLSPVSGSVGTYLTVFGANFGAGGSVHFKNASTGEAIGDISFPAQCAANYWNDSSVTVKVPSHLTTAGVISTGAYDVTILRSDGRGSNAKPFTIDTSPLAPGVCRIDPDNGPALTGVTLYGEGFGDIPQTSVTAIPVDAVTFHDKKNASIGQWQASNIASAVPTGATTGAVVVKKYSGSSPTSSNGVNFQVRDCRQTGGDASCGSGKSCCQDGACRSTCAGPAAAGGFAWQFATGPIPIFPVVLENSTCQISSPVKTPSPNPYKGATDVCSDMGAMSVRFSLPMDPASLTNNVVFESCGTGAAISTACQLVINPGTLELLDFDDDHRSSVLHLPVGVATGTWYRLTLKGNLMSKASLPGQAAAQLDGNFDGKGGGDYVTTFKTGSSPCVLAGAQVKPPKITIDDAAGHQRYDIAPLDTRCIELKCDGRSVSWSSDSPKATIAPTNITGQCASLASPVSETDPGPPLHITGTVDTKSDKGELTIDYANPRVVEYGPRDCTEACVNTNAFARFNTQMATGGEFSILSTPPPQGNVKMFRCDNESCLASESQLVPVHPVWSDSSLTPAQRQISGTRLLTLGNPQLTPNTFYRVVISGAVRSTSDAPLSGLNYNDNAFSWIFRTRADGNPCGPQKVTIEPAQTTLHSISQVAPVTALPLTSPDKCAVNGQILNSSDFNWDWSRTQNPAAPQVFHFLPDAPPPLGALLNTNPVLPAGCSSSCLLTGSNPPGTPTCGNGKLEKGEACDTPLQSGCSATCQRTGNTVLNGCGKDGPEPAKGEECDAGSDPVAGNGTPGSGCSSQCLFAGSSAGAKTVCGNGSRGTGEACDDGNVKDGDGCSSTCLLEGSQQNVFVCGNGTLETGEECDYTSDTGTPRLATTLLAVGHNNPLLPNHEPISLGNADERNPAKPNFACSPSCLMRGNPVACASSTDVGCCGDGTIDFAKGESCDAAADNGQPGSGCSNICTKTGSSPELRGYCGDKNITVKPAVGDVENGGGEECEALTLDPNIDPTQVVESLNQCDAKNSCTASVTAGVSSVSGHPITPVTGEGGVSIECSCRVDYPTDCTQYGSNLSCGAGSCCYPRPAPPIIKPTGGHECRNVQISISFGEEMDASSLQSGLTVQACAASSAREEGGSWLARLGRTVGGFLRSLFGSPASAIDPCATTHDNVTGTFTSTKVVTPNGIRTISTFAPATLFDPRRTYRVTVSSGVKTAKGVSYSSAPPTQEFTTSADVCSFDLVQVDPVTELIQKSSDSLTIRATAMTNHDNQLQAISPITGTYDWTWSWSNVPEATPPGAILALTDGDSPSSVVVQALKGVNGQEQVLATAVIGTDTQFTPSTSTQKKIGKSAITVLLCEQPWPARDITNGSWAPYVDPATHFGFYYCRDNAGVPLPELLAAPVQGQSGVSGTLLRFCQPPLQAASTGQPKACSTNADCTSGETCLSKDLFFQFKQDTDVKDAIGVRVFANPGRLTPQEWFVSQGFSGSTQAATVDGYDAVKDARTVYVGAADKYGDPDLRTYIYVFTFNDKADPRTAETFDRLIKSLRFNTNLTSTNQVVGVCKDGTAGNLSTLAGSTAPVACSSDLDCFRAFTAPPALLHCDSDKDKIRRDLHRWTDIAGMQKALEQIRSTTGFYPKLDSGTFVRGFTTSKWPSWSQMGPAASFADPLNDFNRCADFGSECAITGKACTADSGCAGGTGDVCRPKFEAATCYDDRAGVFACPAASHVYQYRSIGGVDYHMSVDFEYTAYPWLDAACAPHTSSGSCNAAAGCSWLPSGPDTGTCQTRISITPICAGLPVGGTNKCLVPPPSTCVDSASCRPLDHCVPANTPLIGPAVQASCGNGLLEDTEVCEIGQTRNPPCGNGTFKTDVCSAACAWETTQACPGASQCSNGSIEAGESCDDGAQTGQYGRCRLGPLGCAKHCVNTKQRNAFVTGDVSAATCVSNASCGALSVCTDRMNFCGDGVKNGPEVCDDGNKNGEYGFCSWDCRGAGPRCGDTTTNGTEECDGDHSDSAGVCVGSATADGTSIPGTAKACANDADCGAGLTCAICKPTIVGSLPQTRAKSCFPANTPPNPDIRACKFDAWSACKPSGSCGNGKVEGAEECDSGSANSANGACLTNCKKNVCGDGSMQQGIEQCDDGAANGVLCFPQYGLTCNYCKTDCAIETVSGPFCGDSGTGKPPKTALDLTESCDPGPVSAWCSKTYTKLLTPITDPNDLSAPSDVIRGCKSDSGCLPGVCKNYVGATVGSTPCHSSAECGDGSGNKPLQFCLGGEGQCISFNVQCKPEAYSNVKAAVGSPKYFDGTCNTCTSSCGGAKLKSPFFCGDNILQQKYGELCENTGDANATTESSTQYSCGVDCNYAGGYCGDNIVQPAYGETCDTGGGSGLLTNGTITGQVLDGVYVKPVGGLKVQLWDPNVKIADATTDSNGVYQFNNLYSVNSCRSGYHLKILHADNDGTFKSADQNYTFTTLGYQDTAIGTNSNFAFRCAPTSDVEAITANYIQMKKVLLIPKLEHNAYLILVTWKGKDGKEAGEGGSNGTNESNYPDLHLRSPNQHSGQGTNWSSQGNINIDNPEHAHLYCFHEGGTNESCGSFEVRPETMKFKWANSTTNSAFYKGGGDTVFKAWLTDYSCSGDSGANKSTCGNFSKYQVSARLYDENGLKETFGPVSDAGGSYWQLFTIDKNNGYIKLDNRVNDLPGP